jgi:two-component system response regulator NreC
MDKLRILLADDHEAIREGLKMLINAQSDMEVVAEASDGLAAIQRAQQVAPDVVVMDVSMPRLNGLRAIERLKQCCPSANVLTLTRHLAAGYLRQVLLSGASGYVLKQSRASDLLRGLRTVGAGGKFLDPAVTASVMAAEMRAHAGPVDNLTGLSIREEEVLRLIAAGYSNKDAADRLNLSVKTIETHKMHGMHKLGMITRVDLVRFAQLQGWLDDS